MKRPCAFYTVLAFTVLCGLSAFAIVPNAIRYQARVVDDSGLLNVETTIVFRLYNQELSVDPHYVETQTVTIVDGLYATTIGGAPVWDLASVLTNDAVWLEVELAGQVLSPREEILAVPYAMMADGVAEKAITTEMIADGAVSNSALSPNAVTSGNIADATIQFGDIAQNGAGNGQTITWNGAAWVASSVEDGLLSYDENGTFTSAPQAQDVGAIAQGVGARAGAQESVVGGGFSNTIGSGASQATIAGGRLNAIGVNSWRATIGGGENNIIAENSAFATIAGGDSGSLGVDADGSTIGGGFVNKVSENAEYGVIGGGFNNTIDTNADISVIGGGNQNIIAVDTSYATIGGGVQNVISGGGATIGGGGAYDYGSGVTFGGNKAHGSASVIAGGFVNMIQTGASFSAIGGGFGNRIQSTASNSVIAGGKRNAIGDASHNNTIGGGEDNQIYINAYYCTVGGGFTNTIESDSIHATYGATIGGGQMNRIGGWAYNSTIAGGVFNRIEDDSDNTTIGGGQENSIKGAADYAVIGGGYKNDIGSNALHATLSGGYYNSINPGGTNAVIGGGWGNQVRGACGTVAGGESNTANGSRSSIPGGFANTAEGSGSLAAGRYAGAMHDGTFVWSDGTTNTFSTTATNQFLIHAAGGVGINTNAPRAALHVDGNAIIGETENAPTFGMEAVLRQAGDGQGLLFQHPSADIALYWDPDERALTFTNGYTGAVYFDTNMRLYRHDTTTIWHLTSDVSGGEVMAITNAQLGINAAWYLFSIKEDQRGPGLKFEGAGYDDGVSGIVTYWR